MFSEKLKKLRTEIKLTQNELAEKMNVAPSTISMYEQNMRSPDDKMLIKLSKFFNVSIDDLLIDDSEVRQKTKTTSNFDLLPQDVQDLLEELHTRPEMKMMFSVCKDATKEDVLEAVRIIERFKK